ncbi:hypothetical protein ACTJI8_20325 [Microbacterium sp. 22303]|uniref:hypothetical protein n=1 Tax=Microbacterium sp. 22303 TaxID=3453905 RepID=UPI003F86C2C5
MNNHNSSSDPSADRVDFTTPEGLRQTLINLNTHNAWATSPVAAELMVYATSKYTPIARAWHRDPADAAYEAFIAMRQPTTIKATDPWAVVTRAVALGIAAEAHADRNMTSQDKARRPSKRPDEEPVRAGHYEEFFYDVHPHATSLVRPNDMGGAERVIRTTSVFLVVTGWPARQVEQAVDYIAHRITGLSSHQSALDTVTKEHNIALRLGYTPEAWARLVNLIVGASPRKRRPDRLGLLARALLGDTARELLADTDLVHLSREIAADLATTGELP